jgi:peptidoglycan/LPS O-acetylase OafA/YrhL
MESTSAKRRHIIEIDYVRMIVIGLVITTHIAATGVFYNSVTSGFVWMLTHTSRNVFFLLSALVLFYVYQSGRKMNAWTFYARRFGLVAAPYAAWTAIYLVRDGATTGHSVSYFLSRYIYDLATANAMYHLYFMLVIMQLYVIFPFIYRSVPLLKRKGRVIFAISLLVQLVFTTAMFYQWNGGPWLNWWLAHPDNYIWSYQF